MTCEVAIQCTGDVDAAELQRRLTMPGFLNLEPAGERAYRAQFSTVHSANAVVFSLNGTRSLQGHYFEAAVQQQAAADLWNDVETAGVRGSQPTGGAGDWKAFLKSNHEDMGMGKMGNVDVEVAAPLKKRRKVDANAAAHTPAWLLHIPPPPQLRSPKQCVPEKLDMKALRGLAAGKQLFYVRKPTGVFPANPRPLDDDSDDAEAQAPNKLTTCVGLSWAGEKPNLAGIKKLAAKKGPMLTFSVRVANKVAAVSFGTEPQALAACEALAAKYPHVNPTPLSEDVVELYLAGSV
eukprot:TRINITY_DN28538_c0_g1_i1.p1 TRINITY_DN28538_c0_g1~~TRINITY_DN28538_c0_g1_i1.p1  ORF type:complete len:293 (+),score=134.21 TRINITY_DN28538_c0_g1_i1:69-947(+)